MDHKLLTGLFFGLVVLGTSTAIDAGPVAYDVTRRLTTMFDPAMSNDVYKIRGTSYHLEVGFGCFGVEYADKAILYWHGKGNWNNKIVMYDADFNGGYTKKGECRVEHNWVIFEANIK